MSDHPIINLLAVDHSLSDIERIVQALRTAGHMVQESHSDQAAEVRAVIESKPLDLIVVRLAEHLPTIAEVRAWVTDASKDASILAVVDERTRQTPVELLRAGADNLFQLPQTGSEPDAEHLVHVVGKALDHLSLRRRVCACEDRLRESELRFRALLNSSRDAIAYLHEGAHIYSNLAYLNLFGYASEEDLEGITLMNMVIRGDREKLKEFLRRGSKAQTPAKPIKVNGLHSDGSIVPVQIEGIPTRIDDEPCLQIVIRDALQQQDQYRELQRKLDELRQHDVHTGLHNRRFFTDHLKQVRAGITQGKPGGAVVYILLTSYRAISERLGLEAIDQLTLDLANLLRAMVAKGDVVARFSDAVFAIHTANSSRAAVFELGERICKAIEEHASHAAQTLVATTACIGICMVSKDHENATQMLSHADRACEIARQMGGNQVQIYSPPSDEPRATRQEEECKRVIQDAIAGERLSLWYQPIASLNGDPNERYKAYLRILDKNQKALPLTTLRPHAERVELMQALDKWSIMRALEALTERYQLSGQSVILFTRISRNSITAEGFPDWLEKRLKDTGLPGSVLVLEVAEPCAEQYFKEAKTLRARLRDLECGFALSHFGGRSNSERILRHLAPDYIKLDSDFVENLSKTTDGTSRQTMSALTEQARAIQALIIAERIATAPQMASIWQFGVALVQGDVVQEPGPHLNFDFQQFAG